MADSKLNSKQLSNTTSRQLTNQPSNIQLHQPQQSSSTQQQQTDKSESDKSFLERNNVKNILSNLLESLCHHQPDDALDYICN